MSDYTEHVDRESVRGCYGCGSVSPDTSVLEMGARLATAAQLASALCDYLPGDGWELASAIARLCRGEITPEQAMSETEDG